MSKPIVKPDAYPYSKIKIANCDLSEFIHGRICFENKEYRRYYI